MSVVANPQQNRADWLGYVRDPAWLPHIYDARNDTLVFAHLPREAQRRAVFLDPRFLARAPVSAPALVADLPASAIRDAAGPVHFIFHTAFCCSTLLARVFDIPGVSMGVKEPSVLAFLSDFSATGRRTAGALTALALTLDLLSRPLSPGETQIVKPSNVCNHILPSVMHLRPDAKVLILYSSLDSFLRAIARRGVDGRIFARRVFRQFSTAIPLEPAFSPDDLILQSDLQIAAQAWLMQTAFFDSIIRRFGAGRVRVLDSNTLLDDRENVLVQLSRFFELPLDRGAIAAIAAGPVFREHAKNHGIVFDAAAHRAREEAAGVTHFDEINAVRAWARIMAGRSGAPLTLGDTLLA